MVNCCKKKIKNKKINFVRIKNKIVRFKEYTNVEGPTNCKAAMSTTGQCNDNDYDNNISERLVWSGCRREMGRLYN